MRIAGFVAAVAMTGCSSMLPVSKAETPTVWNSYEEAKAAFDTITPRVTTREELHTLGIDPYKASGVKILSYADVLQRFTGAALAQNSFEPNLVECLHVGKRCTGYEIAQQSVQRKRVGNFWLDSLRFVQKTDVSGWSFNGLVLFVDSTVVYTLHGGQPVIRETEVVRNPLGPLQGWGNAASSAAETRVTR
jgi:hypothetical protein